MFMFGLDRIKELGEPFVSVMLTGSTHRPFSDPGPPFRIAEPYVPGSKEAYASILSYADWSLGEFIRAARSTSWFDNTVFIVFGDHPVRIFAGIGTRAADMRDRLHVPMLIYAPGRIEPGVSNTVSSQLDVLPTLMELLGFNGTYSAVGESLLRRTKGWAFISGDGRTLAFINEQGYVSHDRRHRIEAGGTDNPAELDRIERQLLALDAAVFESRRSNRWLRPEAKVAE
jgi:phosphoglycerol transferase MdoB-like AlkP superfamily enzyme